MGLSGQGAGWAGSKSWDLSDSGACQVPIPPSRGLDPLLRVSSDLCQEEERPIGDPLDARQSMNKQILLASPGLSGYPLHSMQQMFH